MKVGIFLTTLHLEEVEKLTQGQAQLKKEIQVVKAYNCPVDVRNALTRSTLHGVEHSLEKPRHRKSKARR